MSTLFDVAQPTIGLSEGRDSGAIRKLLRDNGVKDINPDTVAWCAAYLDAMLGAGGMKQHGSLRAADYLGYGTPTDAPGRGDIAVFKPLARGSSGHVGIVDRVENGRVHYIAGNDGGAVSASSLPLSKVAGFRVPTPGDGSAPARTPAIAADPASGDRSEAASTGSILSRAHALLSTKSDSPAMGQVQGMLRELLSDDDIRGLIGSTIDAAPKAAAEPDAAPLAVSVRPSGTEEAAPSFSGLASRLLDLPERPDSVSSST